jgi:hypothetical protein
VAHPHMNMQVERANSMKLQGLKSHILTLLGEDVHVWLNTRVGKWAAEVPLVLWSLRTMPNRSTGFTPFFMVLDSQTTMHRPAVRVSLGPSLSTKHGRGGGAKGCHRPTRRIKGHNNHKVGKIPAGPPALPHAKSLPLGL